MSAQIEAVQRRLIALGHDIGAADGIAGAKTWAAISTALGATPTKTAPSPAPAAFVPPEWMPAAKMDRIICHWTAGAHKASEFDREHYHILIEDDGKLIQGKPSIKLNEAPAKAGYAAHTLSCNSGSIGVSLCCMGGSVESPFMPGKYPMTAAQWNALSSVVADLCRRYSIKVSDKTVLSHAEVQNNLGIQQRGKWDFTHLAFDPETVGAKACGDKLRAEVSAKL